MQVDDDLFCFLDAKRPARTAELNNSGVSSGPAVHASSIPAHFLSGSDIRPVLAAQHAGRVIAEGTPILGSSSDFISSVPGLNTPTNTPLSALASSSTQLNTNSPRSTYAVSIVNDMVSASLSIWAACRKGDLVRVRDLITTTPEVLNKADPSDSLGNTPLLVAVSSKQEAIVQYLLAVPGQVVDSANREGNTALHLACTANYGTIAQMLVRAGANLHKENSRGWTPLDQVTGDLTRLLLGVADEYRSKAQVSAQHCIVSGPGIEQNDGVVGKETSFTLHTKDGFDNFMRTGQQQVQVKITVARTQGADEFPVASRVVDNADGTYQIFYTPSLPGVYNVHITAGGSPIKASPFSVSVTGDYKSLLASLWALQDKNSQLEATLVKKERQIEDFTRVRGGLETRIEQNEHILETTRTKMKQAIKAASEAMASAEDKKVELQRKTSQLNDLTRPGKQVLRQDWIVKRGSGVKNWKDRYGVLFADKQFHYFEEKGSIDLSAATSIKKITTQVPSCLCIEFYDKKPFFLRAPTEEALQDWLAVLQRVVERQEKRPVAGS
eukprot:TRINITY_DN6341_c0_g1_i2.p1 TRINITY_DN6341_c0_g1~~TRINITY_DN6341_c0_g1_i2.p1  ORF type:complete len:577 (+),score=85.86 TRINITY_DN6341_c0_g1_i2:70-1731(+)